MVSVDTDKLIRDEAKQLVRALLGNVAWVCKEHPRPDLHAVELLDAVIEELQRERENHLRGSPCDRMNAPPTESEVVAGAAVRLGLTVIEMPLREAEPSNVIGLPRIGK